jgi:small subunit ribosomal protein S33
MIDDARNKFGASKHAPIDTDTSLPRTTTPIITTMAVPRQRVLALMQASCRVFNTTYNPDRVRLGSRILHQRLKGAAVASYYPPRIGTIPQLRSLYPEHEILDDKEEDWLEHLGVAKSRGKSPPKKKRTAEGGLIAHWVIGDADTDTGRIQEGQEEEVRDGPLYHCTNNHESISHIARGRVITSVVLSRLLHHILALAHSRSNSSSHASRTLTWSGCTGALTLWCSAVQ